MIINIILIIASIMLLLAVGYLLYIQNNNIYFLNQLFNWEYVIFTPIGVICYIVNSIRLQDWFTVRDNFSLLYFIMLLVIFPIYKCGWTIYKKKFIDRYDIPNYYQQRFLGGFAMMCIFVPTFGFFSIIFTILH
jgi:hypothetical protein